MNKPLVASLCGTYLKAEMQSIYRQLANLERHSTAVYTERAENLESFPLERIEVMEKRERPRHRGNFLKRYYFKHIKKQWPPPTPIGHAGRELGYYHPYDMVDKLRADEPALAHVYYGHKAVKYHRMLRSWGGPWLVSFHGIDVVKFFDQPGYHEKMKAVFDDAQLVLARSESLLARLAELGCPKEKLRLNRTPVPLPEGQPRIPPTPPDGSWRLLQACRLVEKKGILTALRAIAEISQDFPKLRYVLCGDGPLHAQIYEEAVSLGIADQVEILGWLNQEQLHEEFSKAHLFLHPSELTAGSDQEGVPNAMLEAMASGLPIVATQHGGIPEAVTDEHDGLLVEEKNHVELAAALKRLFKDPQLAEKLAVNAPISAREKYGLPASIEALEDCYAEAIVRAGG